MLKDKRRLGSLARRSFQAAGYTGIPIEHYSGSVRRLHPQPITFTCNGTSFDPTDLRRWLQDHQVVLQVSDSLPDILARARKTDESREVRLVPKGQTYVSQDNKPLFVEELAELLRLLYTHSITEVSFPFILDVSVLTKEGKTKKGKSPLLSVLCAHDAKVVMGKRVDTLDDSDL